MDKIDGGITLLDTITNAIRGFLMALADSVPGVSGGTIAYLLGFFDKFIYSLNYLIKGSRAERKKAIVFLLKLGIGWVIGMILSISLLAGLFEEHIYSISSLFLGFLIAAIPIMAREESEHLRGKPRNLVWGLLGMLVVVLLSSIKLGGTVDATNLSIGMALYVFIAGALAISAMVLPGISGSTLLLGFGLYMPIVTGVKDILHGNFASFGLIMIFAIGIVVGILTTLRGIKKLLDNKRSAVVYAILGMMVGSLYAIVIGPTTMKTPQPALDWQSFSPLLFLVGVALVFGLQLVKGKIEARNRDLGKSL